MPALFCESLPSASQETSRRKIELSTAEEKALHHQIIPSYIPSLATYTMGGMTEAVTIP